MAQIITQEFNIEKLKEQIYDNTLSLVKFHDIKANYPERYEIRRSTIRKRIMNNHVWRPYYQYHLFLWIDEADRFQDIGTIHPNDIIRRLDDNEDTIMITQIEIKELN